MRDKNSFCTCGVGKQLNKTNSTRVPAWFFAQQNAKPYVWSKRKWPHWFPEPEEKPTGEGKEGDLGAVATGCCQALRDQKAVRNCGATTRVHCGVSAFSENSEEQQHYSVEWNSTRVTQPGPDASTPLLSWITDVLSKVARSHPLIPWSTKLQDLRKQRTWEPKMWSFVSVGSLTQLLLSRSKSNFSWLLNPPLSCSCISLDPSLFLLSAAEGLFSLMSGLPGSSFGLSYVVFSMVSFHLGLLLSACLPCFLLDGLWMSLAGHWTTCGPSFLLRLLASAAPWSRC